MARSNEVPMRMRSLLFVLALTLPLACAERKIAGPPPSQSTASVLTGPAPIESTIVEAAPPPPAPVLEKTWQEAVRVERWGEAAELLDALSETELQKPKIKYVRARVAIAMHDEAKAVTLLDGLEASLPISRPTSRATAPRPSSSPGRSRPRPSISRSRRSHAISPRRRRRSRALASFRRRR